MKRLQPKKARNDPLCRFSSPQKKCYGVFLFFNEKIWKVQFLPYICVSLMTIDKN